MQTEARTQKRRLFEAARDQIVMDILSSHYKLGDFYATERDLCKRLKVGRNTIRKAITQLENAGMIRRRQRVGIIIAEKACSNVPVVAPKPEPPGGSRVAFILPHWDNSAGNFLSTTVLGELRNGDDSQQRFAVEMRLWNDPLDDLDPETSALIVVDPMQSIIPMLAELKAKGIKIIAVEPKMALFLAANIQYNVRKAAYDAVVQLFNQGHRSIGLVNNGIVHYTFQEWMSGFIDAHNDLGLSVAPNAIAISLYDERVEQAKGVTAWICTHDKATDRVAATCARLGKKVPEDVAIIGSDDPGKSIPPGMGCLLTVVRPDYHALSRIIRQVLCGEVTVQPGETIHCPMTWVYRDSFKPAAL